MFKKMLLASAISAAFAATPSIAQQQQGGGQQYTSNQAWSQEQASGQGTQVFLGTAAVRQIQQQMDQAGFNVGNIDGTWNNQMASAIADYQRRNGLEPTGTLTLSFLNSIGMQNVLNKPMQSTGGGQGNQSGAQGQENGVGGPIYVGPAGVRKVQQELNKRGYDVGQVDGEWNQQTAQAVQNFQRSNGLEPNGKLDVNLIAALGGTQEIFSPQGQTSGGGNMQSMQESASGPGVPLWVSPATVRHVEQKLSDAGYNVGQADGQWDQQNVEAVMAFQRANGMEPTGTLTTGLLASVGQGHWTQGHLVGNPQSTGQSSGGQQQSTGQSGQQQDQQAGQQQGGMGQSSGGGQGGQQQSSGQMGGQQQGGGMQGGQGGQQPQGFGQSSGGQSAQQQGGSGQTSDGQGGQQQSSGQGSGGMQSGQGGQQQQSGFGQSGGSQQQGSSSPQGQQQGGFSQSSGGQSGQQQGGGQQGSSSQSSGFGQNSQQQGSSSQMPSGQAQDGFGQSSGSQSGQQQQGGFDQSSGGQQQQGFGPSGFDQSGGMQSNQQQGGMGQTSGGQGSGKNGC